MCEPISFPDVCKSGQAASRRLQPDQGPRPQPLQQPFQYDEDVASARAPLPQTLPGLSRPSRSMSSDGDAGLTSLKRLIVPGRTSSLTPSGGPSSPPGRASPPGPLQVLQAAPIRRGKQAPEASGSALDADVAGGGDESRDADKGIWKEGSRTDSRSSQAQQQTDYEQSSHPRLQSEKPEMLGKTEESTRNRQRPAEAASAKSGAVNDAQLSQKAADASSAREGSESRSPEDRQQQQQGQQTTSSACPGCPNWAQAKIHEPQGSARKQGAPLENRCSPLCAYATRHRAMPLQCCRRLSHVLSLNALVSCDIAIRQLLDSSLWMELDVLSL